MMLVIALPASSRTGDVLGRGTTKGGVVFTVRPGTCTFTWRALERREILPPIKPLPGQNVPPAPPIVFARLRAAAVPGNCALDWTVRQLSR